MRKIGRVIAAVALLTIIGVPSAMATPFTIETVLIGDPRPDSPDGLRVVVTITGDTESNLTYWTVDLDMDETHPDARLNEFGFNLRTPPEYTFDLGSFNLPYTQTVGTLDGSGSTLFLLTLNDPSGHRRDATNDRSLTFTVTRSEGFFSLNDFLLAPESCSSDTFLGCNQLGAHIQSIGINNEDSGVAVGNYSVPEPGTLLLVSLGCAVAGIRRRTGRGSRE